MADGDITPADIEHYKSYVGRAAAVTDMIDRSVATRFAATLDAELDYAVLPPMWHYGLFLTTVGTSRLDTDGHPRRGDFLPPVRLPRRMFAGATLKFIRPLEIGKEIARTSRIASVDHRKGKTGDLVFVRVAMTYMQTAQPSLEEKQTIVYRPAGTTTPPVVPAPRKALESNETFELWLPTTVELFRYSSSTFNSHRIHYDRPYVTGEEGYPDLVVHGPLIATRLCNFAIKTAGRTIREFTFRGEAPCFVQQEVRIVARMIGNTCTVRAERADGITAMSATATF